MSGVVRIDLDRSSPVPLYHQVASAIDAAVAGGDLQPGEFLENEISLATRLGISRPTARQAFQELVDRGVVVRQRGVGTRVASARVRRPVGLTSLFDDLAESGRRPTTEVLAHEETAAQAEVAAALEVADGTEVVRIQRLRLADDEPLALLTNFLPVALAPSPDELVADGLYACLRARGVRPKVARQRIGARIATAAESRLLGEPPRAALLTMERTAYDEAGRPIEFGVHIYRSSKYMFDTTVFTA